MLTYRQTLDYINRKSVTINHLCNYPVDIDIPISDYDWREVNNKYYNRITYSYPAPTF